MKTSLLLTATTLALGSAMDPTGKFHFRKKDEVHGRRAAKIFQNSVLSKSGEKHETTLEANEPKICGNAQSYSGYFNANGRDKYFYWFFESRRDPSNDPMIMWLTGGPGCSSQMALLVENGPCFVNDAATDTVVSQTSWNTQANAMWVDQPPGTGFSTGSLDKTEDEIAEDMYDFLQNFMAAFPQYFKNGFYVFGESYAGHYVPAITYHIFEMNEAGKNPNIPLKAFAIGNGLTDPYIQYAYYAQMAYDSGYAPSVISENTYNIMERHIPTCQKYIEECQSSTPACTQAQDYCEIWEMEPVTATGINPYDLRIPCEVPGLCYNFTNVDTWLNNDTVQQALGVDMKWGECNNGPHIALTNDWMLEYQEKLPPMLDAGIRGLIYAGDQDWICNWLGNKAWATQLDWNGLDGFSKAADKPWSPDGTQRGIIRSYEDFTFLQVFQAGHMVPMDQPVSALLMVNDWLDNTLA